MECANASLRSSSRARSVRPFFVRTWITPADASAAFEGGSYINVAAPQGCAERFLVPLPAAKGSFKANDVRKLVPGVAAGTLSQRLTGWVKEKKLKRTGSRRGTRYTRA